MTEEIIDGVIYDEHGTAIAHADPNGEPGEPGPQGGESVESGPKGSPYPHLPKLPKRWRGAKPLGGHNNPGIIKDSKGQTYVRQENGQVRRAE
jgi:hypothetical protein